MKRLVIALHVLNGCDDKIVILCEKSIISNSRSGFSVLLRTREKCACSTVLYKAIFFGGAVGLAPSTAMTHFLMSESFDTRDDLRVSTASSLPFLGFLGVSRGCNRSDKVD